MGYSHIKASGIFGDLDIVDLIPKNTFNILISQKLDRNNRVGLNYSQVGPMRFETAGTDLDGYSTLNLKYDHDLIIADKPSTLSITARDLMGEYGDYNANHFVVTTQYFIGLSIGL
jgi:hypothetical protein